jgi:spore coat protein U-like protein
MTPTLRQTVFLQKLAVSTALLAASSSVSLAQSVDPKVATRNFEVAAAAPQVCAVSAPQLDNGQRVNIRALAGDALTIDRLTNPATLSTEAASAEVRFPSFCNYPHLVTIESESNGLWRDGSTLVPAGFASAVPYTATLAWGGRREALLIDASSQTRRQRSVPVAGGIAGDMVLTLAITRGAANLRTNAPLLAGRYADTLRITVGPQ